MRCGRSGAQALLAGALDDDESVDDFDEPESEDPEPEELDESDEEEEEVEDEEVDSFAFSLDAAFDDDRLSVL
jgi:hypothetical protein